MDYSIIKNLEVFFISKEYAYKICIFGDAGVGKTSLARKYLEDTFDDDIKSTVGVNIGIKRFNIGDYNIMLQIWDFAGEDRFKFYFPIYANGSNGGIFMYDITRENTINNVIDWLSIFNEKTQAKKFNIPILLIGGKSDLDEKRVISIKEWKKLLNLYNFYDFMECSALTGQNVEDVFQKITDKIMKIAGIF